MPKIGGNEKTRSIDLSIAQALREARKSRRLTTKDLAGAIGCSYQMVQHYETAQSRISVSAFIEICRVLGISPGGFLDLYVEEA